MKPHEGLVSKELLRDLRYQLWPEGAEALLRRLHLVEPELADSLRIMITNALKLLDEYVVPAQVRAPLQDLLLAIAVTSVLAIRTTHRELWDATARGTKLELLDADGESR